MTLLGAQHYASTSEARANFKNVLDAAILGKSVTVHRDSQAVAVVDADRYRKYLAHTVTVDVRVFEEDGAFAMAMTDPGIAVEHDDYSALVAEMTLAMREYAEDWQDHLSSAPNHAENWGLVQLIELSDDEQLAAWLLSSHE